MPIVRPACTLRASSRAINPGELPVMQTAKYEFVLNLKTARALGIDVPMAFSAAADEIIE